MTEVEWIEAKNVTWMLQLLTGVSSDRKLRLFAVGCCYCVHHLLTDQRSHTAVEVAERYADGLASDEARAEAHREAVSAAVTMQAKASRPGSSTATMAQVSAANAASLASVSPLALSAAEVVWQVLAAGWGGVKLAEATSRRESPGSLLGHIMGPPCPPCSLPQVSLTVRDLAEAIYQQRIDAIGPLHDALVDAGLTDLAEHFSDPAERHPKGCWAVDLLTGRR